MNKEQYLKKLRKKLKGMPEVDREDALRFYEDYIDEACLADARDVEQVLGMPETVAGRILEECMEKEVNRQNEENTIKGSSKIIWLALLGVCAAPVAFPVAVAAVIVYLAFLVCLAAIGFSILAAGVALGVSGLATFIGVIWAVGFGQKLVLLGFVCILIALSMLAGILFYRYVAGMVSAIVTIHRKLFGKKEEKRA